MTTPAATWLSVAEVAARAGVSERSVRLAIRACERGRDWRGARLAVRAVAGESGGGAGGVSYRVREDSLPIGLRGAVPAAAGDVPPPAVRGADAPAVPVPADDGAGARLWQFRHSVIAPILAHERGSPERAAAIEAAARVDRLDPSGRTVRVSVRSIQRWIAAYEEHGMAGLRRKPQANRGRARVCISRAWDAAVPFDDATRARIAETVARDIRSLWAATTDCGWPHIARLAGVTLAKETAAAGFDPGPKRLRTLCRVPRGLVERGRPHRAVAVHDRDRKRWVDESVPRIRRTRGGRRPMEIVIGDVHPIDILLVRDDGSSYTPKLIAWLDWATNRVFGYPVFLPKGKAVRQEHVIEAFVAMAADARWGVPEHLYLDNGGEYNWAAFVEDAMQLNSRMRLLGDDRELAGAVRARRSAIVKALPYNAAAKPIESAFATLEGGFLSLLPGWIGGDRMKKKTANLGREPAPYPGGEEAFRRSLALMLEAYETHPQGGALGGRSPRQAFADRVAAGWKRTDIDPGALRAVFSRAEPRTIRQGAFAFKGARYTARELQRLPAGTKVTVRIPVAGGTGRLAVLDERGDYLCIAEPVRGFDIFDTQGAREAAAGRREARAGIEALRAATDRVDLQERVAEAVGREDPAPVPDRESLIDLGGAWERIGREMARCPADRKAAEVADYERRQAKRIAAAEAVLKKIRASG